MNPKKQSRRKNTANKLEPIDWREFANDAVLNGNMSTLYRRPPSEDPSAYASPEAMIEIEKRVIRTASDAETVESPTAPTEPSSPTAGFIPTVGNPPTDNPHTDPILPTVGTEPSVGAPRHESFPPTGQTRPTACPQPTVGPMANIETAQVVRKPSSRTSAPVGQVGPTAGFIPTVGTAPADVPLPSGGVRPTVGTKKKVRAIRTVHDALTLAGQVLYRAMLNTPDAPSASCTKGYRQLAAETHLDKDTVRDLIVEFKHKGILYETATYDPDTRLSKTYEVLSHQVVLQAWRAAGIQFVTAGRQRPLFCSATGNLIDFIPTVGMKPIPKT